VHYSILEEIECDGLITTDKPYNCPICRKPFRNEALLDRHTGTNDPNLRKSHACLDCNKICCSQEAIEQHRTSHKSKMKAHKAAWGAIPTLMDGDINTASVRSPCDFSSIRNAMEKCRNGTAPRTGFVCNVCKKVLMSELTLAYHEQSDSHHKKMVELAEFEVYVDLAGDDVSLCFVSKYE
jgi:hypothetical protein